MSQSIKPIEDVITITRRATAKALLECAELMQDKKLSFYEARKQLKDNNTYWLSANNYFSILRYAGEGTMPYASIEQQIDLILLTREHILQTGLLNVTSREILE